MDKKLSRHESFDDLLLSRGGIEEFCFAASTELGEMRGNFSPIRHYRKQIYNSQTMHRNWYGSEKNDRTSMAFLFNEVVSQEPTGCVMPLWLVFRSSKIMKCCAKTAEKATCYDVSLFFISDGRELKSLEQMCVCNYLIEKRRQSDHSNEVKCTCYAHMHRY